VGASYCQGVFYHHRICACSPPKQPPPPKKQQRALPPLSLSLFWRTSHRLEQVDRLLQHFVDAHEVVEAVQLQRGEHVQQVQAFLVYGKEGRRVACVFFEGGWNKKKQAHKNTKNKKTAHQS
jgi:hypothetical protein